MTNESIQAVQDAFKTLAPIQDELGGMFYTRLFQVDPGLRPLFGDDIAKQGHMLMTALRLVVDGLDTPNTVSKQLAEIGKRHQAYGASPADFDTFGAALVWTLKQGLGPQYTPEFEAGWVQAFELIRMNMRQSTR